MDLRLRVLDLAQGLDHHEDANPVIQRTAINQSITPPFFAYQLADEKIDTIPLREANSTELLDISKERRLALDLAEMQAIGLRDCDEPPPSLAEMLALVAGRVPLLIEIKDQTDAMAETDGRLEAATARALAGYDGAVALMSFNPHSVAHLARLAPGIPRGLTTSAYVAADWAPLDPARCDALRAIADYDCTGSSFISHEAADLGRPRVAELKAQGAAILTWTIRSPAEEAKARAVAQNITFENYAAALPA